MVHIPNAPITNAGVLYVYGLDYFRGSTLRTIINAGAARDSTNTNDIVVNVPLDVFGNRVGPNGCDLAVFVPSRIYALYVIGDSNKYNPTAGLYSLNPSDPILPNGYDMYRRIGWVLTDATSIIVPFTQYGRNNDRVYYYETGIPALTAGNATAFADVPLIASVPPIATTVTFDVSYTASAAANIAEFNPFGSSAGIGILKFGYGVAATQRGPIIVPCGLNVTVPTIRYRVSAAGNSLTLLTTSYSDYL